MKDKFNRFSVPPGFPDYVNFILHVITMMTMIKNISGTVG